MLTCVDDSLLVCYCQQNSIVSDMEEVNKTMQNWLSIFVVSSFYVVYSFFLLVPFLTVE